MHVQKNIKLLNSHVITHTVQKIVPVEELQHHVL